MGFCNVGCSVNSATVEPSTALASLGVIKHPLQQGKGRDPSVGVQKRSKTVVGGRTLPPPPFFNVNK